MDGNNWNRCWPDRFFGDASEEYSLDATTTTGPHHDGVDITRFNVFSDHLCRRAMSNVRIHVWKVILFSFRIYIFDSLSRRTLEFSFREYGANVRTYSSR